MNARTRAKRRTLRERRYARRYGEGPVLLGPMTGWDLFVLQRYAGAPAHLQTPPAQLRQMYEGIKASYMADLKQILGRTGAR